MPIYDKAPIDVVVKVMALMERYHGPLHDSEVTIDVLMADPTPDANGEIDPAEPAVKLHGYPCLAVVRINSYKNRVLGHGDAEITIDRQRWEEQSEEQRDALIDHELQHLELKTDRDGNLVRDDLGRPKLRMRKHDHQFGWFDAIARRHGEASFEIQQHNAFLLARQQLWLPFETDEEAGTERDDITTTFSAKGQSVTLTGKDFKKLSKAVKDGSFQRAAAGSR